MLKACEQCGNEYLAQRSTARFCSDVCRSAATKAKARNAANAQLTADETVVSIVGRKASVKAPRTPPNPGAGGVEKTLTRELGDALDTSVGQQAVILARRIDSGNDTSAGLVAASKQLLLLTAAALREKAPDAENDLVGTVQADVIAIRQQYANAGT